MDVDTFLEACICRKQIQCERDTSLPEGVIVRGNGGGCFYLGTGTKQYALRIIVSFDSGFCRACNAGFRRGTIKNYSPKGGTVFYRTFEGWDNSITRNLPKILDAYPLSRDLLSSIAKTRIYSAFGTQVLSKHQWKRGSGTPNFWWNFYD